MCTHQLGTADISLVSSNMELIIEFCKSKAVDQAKDIVFSVIKHN